MSTLTLSQRLMQAEAAYHELITGQAAVVIVDKNGERVEFARANAIYLRRYIDELKAQSQGVLTTHPGPLNAYF